MSVAQMRSQNAHLSTLDRKVVIIDVVLRRRMYMLNFTASSSNKHTVVYEESTESDEGFMVPAWSLGVTFVSTVLCCLIILAVSVRYRKNRRNRKFLHRYTQNGGRVTIGKRRLNEAAKTDKYHNGIEIQRNIPDIRIGGSTCSASTMQSCPDYCDNAKLGVKLDIPLSSNISMASGVYAQMNTTQDALNVGDGSLFTPSNSLNPNNSAAGSHSNSSMFGEGSYFTPVFRQRPYSTEQREFPTPGIINFSKSVRKHLTSTISAIGGGSVGTDNETTTVACSVYKNRLEISDNQIRPHPSVTSLHEVIDNTEATNNNCTYLTFNDISALNTPPVSSIHHNQLHRLSSEFKQQTST